MRIAISQGDGSFQDLGIIPGSRGSGVSFGDIDRDGWLDAVRYSNRIAPLGPPEPYNQVSYGSPDGFGPVVTETNSKGATGKATFGDFNGDRRQDIAFNRDQSSADQRLEIQLNDPVLKLRILNIHIPKTLAGLRFRGARVKLSCSVPCSATSRLRVSKRLRRRADLASRTLAVKTSSGETSEPVTQFLRIGRHDTKRIRRSGVPRVHFRIKATAEASSGPGKRADASARTIRFLARR